MTRYSWDRRAMGPARKIPVVGTLKFVGAGPLVRSRGVPARESATLTELSTRFRDGVIYAYSWDEKRAVWEVWRSEADWLATERNDRVARPDLAAAGHGPVVYTPAPTPAPTRRPGKAEYVALLRRIVDGVDWSVDELTGLLERETAA